MRLARTSARRNRHYLNVLGEKIRSHLLAMIQSIRMLVLMPPWCRILLSEAVKKPVGPKQQLTLMRHGRSVGPAVVVLEHVMGQQLKFGFGRDHVAAVMLRNVKELPFHQNRRRIDFPGGRG